MSKCVISLGFKNYIVDTEQAIALGEMLSKAEMFEQKYQGSGMKDTFHVWEQDGEESKFTITILPDSIYRIGKLAGRHKGEK